MPSPEITKGIYSAFGHRLRLRVSGICIQDDRILLVKHHSLGEKGILWAPPGGGLQYGESIEETLKREFLEETGLVVEMREPVLINEYMQDPLHAVELFFRVTQTGGELKRGYDPELGQENQIIQEVCFVSFADLRKQDPTIFHSLFRSHNRVEHFRSFLGYEQNIVSRRP